MVKLVAASLSSIIVFFNHVSHVSISDGVISLFVRGKLEVYLHDTSPGLRCEHVPQGAGYSTTDCMNHIRLCEGGNENTEDHLIPLTPRKKDRIDHGGRSFNSSTGIRNSLGRRRRRTIQKPVSIMFFDVGKDLSPPGHEILFGQFDM